METQSQFFHQAWTLTRASIKTRYRNTISGIVWVILNPVLMFGAQATVFHYILKLDVRNYPLFLLSGLLPWIFLMQTVEMGTGSFTVSHRLLKSFPIHPGVILFSQVFDNLINFMLSFTVILLPTAIYMGFDLYRFLLLPLCPLPLFVFVFSFVWALATLQVFFWDTRFVMSFLMGVMFYLTPIIYPIEFIADRYRPLMALNPFWTIIRPFQEAVSGTSIPQFLEAYAISWALALLMLAISFLTWRRVRDAVYFQL